MPLAVLVLSPAILPGLNLMLDLPALALSLAAVSLFLRAVSADSLVLATFSGFVCGLALETKYTALSTLGVMLAASAVSRRWRQLPVAVLVTAHVFLTWELLMAFLYGQSHFLASLSQQDATWGSKWSLLSFLPSYLGGVAGPILLLGLVGLGVRWPGLLAVGVGFLLLYGSIATFEVKFVNDLIPTPVEVPLAEPLFDVVGFALAVLAIWLVVRFVRNDWSRQRGPGLVGREGVLLALWLVLEILAFAVLTPFPATRRVLALCVVPTLLAARALSQLPRPPARVVCGALVAFSALLGLGFAALDTYARQDCAAGGDRSCRRTSPHEGAAPPGSLATGASSSMPNGPACTWSCLSMRSRTARSRCHLLLCYGPMTGW